MEVRPKDTEVFTPFEIVLKFDTPEDVTEFWHRLNLPHALVRSYSSAGVGPILNPNSSKIVWKYIDDVVRKYGLKLWKHSL
jgi:hypothetical protein